MEIRIQIPDELAAQARRCAVESDTTLEKLVEAALLHELEWRATPSGWHANPDLAFGEGGLTETAKAMSWDLLRDMAQER